MIMSYEWCCLVDAKLALNTVLSDLENGMANGSTQLSKSDSVQNPAARFILVTFM
jgi:hypothetical protein